MVFHINVPFLLCSHLLRSCHSFLSLPSALWGSRAYILLLCPQILLKFWSMMLSDKKYIKTQIVGGESE